MADAFVQLSPDKKKFIAPFKVAENRKEWMSQYNRWYRENHQDKVKAGLKKWNKENPERKLELSRLSRHRINKKDIKEFQLLCANCNWIKRFENEEHN